MIPDCFSRRAEKPVDGLRRKTLVSFLLRESSVLGDFDRTKSDASHANSLREALRHDDLAGFCAPVSSWKLRRDDGSLIASKAL